VSTADRPRVLITGANGFAGRYLAAYAAQQRALVYGISRHGDFPEFMAGTRVDLGDAQAAAQALERIQPDYVVHLAAQTPANTPGPAELSWLQTNPLMTFNLLEAVRRHCPGARVLVVSSSAVYGHVPEQALPIREDEPLRPTTMYGVSKAAQELVAIRFEAEHGLRVLRARPFNQLGPGEPRAMLTSALAAQVADIAGRRSPPVVRMRHRATQRDFTDIRDAVRAYWTILERGTIGEVYNVCSGAATPIGKVAAQLLELAHIAATIEETGHGPTPGDILIQVGSHAKLTQAAGWRPEIDLRTSLADVLGAFV
jgi:GDP-4-dehydro-6-deoxy-D-mannose reductase